MNSTNNYLNLRRLRITLYSDILSNKWKIVIAAEALAGILLFLYVFIGTGKIVVGSLYRTFYPTIIIVTGIITTSLSFSELYTGKSYYYLTLPSSSIEKLLSKLLINSIGYLLGINFLLIIITIAANGISLFLFENSFPIFNPIHPNIFKSELFYLIAQNIFLFGAIYFKRYNFLKTILLISGPIFFIGIFPAVIFKIMYWNYHETVLLKITPGYSISPPSLDFISNTFNRIIEILVILFYYVTAPLFLFLSYLRLRESEG